MTNLASMEMILPLEVNVEPCVYTTQFSTWLKEGSVCADTDLICFRSNKPWVTAAKLLSEIHTLPVLFRQQEDSNAALACRFVAELVEIKFVDQFANDDQRLDWLNEKLWFQREIIKGPARDEIFPTWEEQLKKWEIDKFMLAKTWYIVRHLREIKSLPLPRLRKLVDNQPLATNFKRGYALCHYPNEEVEFMSEQNATEQAVNPPFLPAAL
jgi:hypothetical protein